MESSPRTASIIINDLERRLKHLQTCHVHDDQTLNDLECLLSECSNHLNRLISSSDSTLISIILPSLLHTIISLSKICAEKSDAIIPGAYLSREKLTSLITTNKSLYNQIKEFLKSPKLITLVTTSPQLRHFCEQLRCISDSISNTDIVTTLICQKLIIKLITGSDEQQQSSFNSIQEIDDGLTVAVYGSVLRQLEAISGRSLKEKLDNNRESPTIKVISFVSNL